MRDFAVLILVPMTLLLPLQQAFAASKQALERTAKKACIAGDTAKGVEILAELYVDTNDITYVFNQGRCFEQNRRYDDAIGRFREYLVKGDEQLSADAKALAKRHIETCESYLPKTEQHAPLAPVPAAVPLNVQPQPAQALAEPSVAVVQRPQQSGERAGSGLRFAGIAVGSLGVAALVSGVILNLKVNSMSSDLGKLDNFNRDTDSSRKDYKTLGWVSYGLGAACLAGGSLLYYLGWRSSGDSRPSVALVPDLAPDTAGAVFTGAF